MRIDADAIAFHPVTQNDMALLRQWMKKPHWRRWWGDPDTELAMIQAMVDGEDTTRPYIFSIEGEAIGYIQYWIVADSKKDPTLMAANPWLAWVPEDAIGIDLSIGEAHHLSKGIGSRALRDFAEMLAGRGHANMIIDPDPMNMRAIHAYKKAGFRPIESLKGRTDDVLLMKFHHDE